MGSKKNEKGRFNKKHGVYEIKYFTPINFSMRLESVDPTQQLIICNRCCCGYLFKRVYNGIYDIFCPSCYNDHISDAVKDLHKFALAVRKDFRTKGSTYNSPDVLVLAVMDLFEDLCGNLEAKSKTKSRFWNIQDTFLRWMNAQMVWREKYDDSILSTQEKLRRQIERKRKFIDGE